MTGRTKGKIMTNDLLDDLKAEGYADDLANGNLRGKSRDTLERFTSEGFRAVIDVLTCRGCGAVHRSLAAIMHQERGDKGSSRAQALHLGHAPNIDTDPKPNDVLERFAGVC